MPSARKPPTTAPTRPRAKVAIQPMAWRPGMISRPRAPMTMPAKMAVKMPPVLMGQSLQSVAPVVGDRLP